VSFHIYEFKHACPPIRSSLGGSHWVLGSYDFHHCFPGPLGWLLLRTYCCLTLEGLLDMMDTRRVLVRGYRPRIDERRATRPGCA